SRASRAVISSSVRPSVAASAAKGASVMAIPSRSRAIRLRSAASSASGGGVWGIGWPFTTAARRQDAAGRSETGWAGPGRPARGWPRGTGTAGSGTGSVDVLLRVHHVELAGRRDQARVLDHMLQLQRLVIDDDDGAFLVLGVPDAEPD